MTDQHWAPARIWLQRGVGEEGSHTWCEDSVGDGGIIEEAEYVRVDSRTALVNRGALQVAVNMLRRDAEEGRIVRGEVAEELMQYVAAPPPVSTNRLTVQRICEIWLEQTGVPEESVPHPIIEFALAIIAATEAK